MPFGYYQASGACLHLQGRQGQKSGVDGEIQPSFLEGGQALVEQPRQHPVEQVDAQLVGAAEAQVAVGELGAEVVER